MRVNKFDDNRKAQAAVALISKCQTNKVQHTDVSSVLSDAWFSTGCRGTKQPGEIYGDRKLERNWSERLLLTFGTID